LGGVCYTTLKVVSYHGDDVTQLMVDVKCTAVLVCVIDIPSQAIQVHSQTHSAS